MSTKFSRPDHATNNNGQLDQEGDHHQGRPVLTRGVWLGYLIHQPNREPHEVAIQANAEDPKRIADDADPTNSLVNRHAYGKRGQNANAPVSKRLLPGQGFGRLFRMNMA